MTSRDIVRSLFEKCSKLAALTVVLGPPIAAIGFLIPLQVNAQNGPARLILSSTAFTDGGEIPAKYSCAGQNLSPPLSWSGVPANARSLILVVSDPDAPGGTFVHWVVYNLPVDKAQLPEDIDTKKPVVPGGGQQGMNDFGKYGWSGPCPPPGKPHHYHFKIDALDTSLKAPSGAEAGDVEEAAAGHVVGSGELVGTYGRK